VSAPAEHHPVFAKFKPYEGQNRPGFEVDFVGVATDCKFIDAAPQGRSDTSYPPFDEDYFEWIDVLESVLCSKDEYVMVELGAGFGRWSARAAYAAKQLNIYPRLIAVEPEPKHFSWLLQHFCNNALNPSEHDLLDAAISDTNAPQMLCIEMPGYDRADRWYGQALLQEPGAWTGQKYESFNVFEGPAGWKSIEVPSIRLGDLFDVLISGVLSRVDLMDFDIQGQEAAVIRDGIDLIDERVARLHIGTHSREIEAELRALLTDRGWTKVFDYPCASTSETPWGAITFVDGVQSWLNPRF
jgi:FkbM family methyltransferase